MWFNKEEEQPNPANQPSLDDLEKNLRGGEDTGQPEQHNQPQAQAASTHTVTLPDGQQFTGTDKEINERYAQVMQQARQMQQSGSQPGFNVEEWGTKLQTDPLEGMNYLDKHRFGFDPKQAMYNMAAKITELQQALENVQFSQDETLKDPANRQVAQSYVSSGRARNIQDAVLLAKAEGRIKVQQTSQQPPQQASNQHPWETGSTPQAPPQLNGGYTQNVGTGGGMSEDQVRSMTNDLSIGQLEQLINRMSSN